MSLYIIRRTMITAAAFLLAFGLYGCGKKQEERREETDMTDQMWTEHKKDEIIYLFQMDNIVYTVDNVYIVDYYINDSTVNGGFYKVTADIDYLNGGIAGYVDYPKIKDVAAIEEVSPLDLDLPSVKETIYGLTLIGDYADGDIFLNENGQVAVWKDGEWIWKYEKNNSFISDSGSKIYMAQGISKEEALEGIADGILSCEDYFALPAAG